MGEIIHIKPEYKAFKGDIEFLLDGVRLMVHNMEASHGRKLTEKEGQYVLGVFSHELQKQVIMTKQQEEYYNGRTA